MYLNLESQRFSRINMSIDIKEDVELQIESKFDFNINYIENSNKCVATMKCDVCNTGSKEMLKINIEMQGIMSYEGIDSDEKKQTAHVQACTLLFPYIQSMVANMTVSAGLPPLMLAMPKINPSCVNFNK